MKKPQVIFRLLTIAVLCGVLYCLIAKGPWTPYVDAFRDALVSLEILEERPVPDDPVKPLDPVDPIEPVDPVDPVDPVEPAEPIDPGVLFEPSYRYSTDVSAYWNAISTSYSSILLVNKSNPLGADFVPANLVDLKNDITTKSIKLDATAAAALEAMMLCMRADGITDTLVTSGYRSYDYQVHLRQGYYTDERAKGYDDATAWKLVDKYSAPEGMSEHQSGLCVDFITRGMGGVLDNSFEQSDAFRWLQENACRFGFILRYPEDKVHVTKYSYESWHYRFVGHDAAVAITEQGLTLEEYLGAKS